MNRSTGEEPSDGNEGLERAENPKTLDGCRALVVTSPEIVGILDDVGVLHCHMDDGMSVDGLVESPILEFLRPIHPEAFQEFINVVFKENRPMSRAFFVLGEMGEEIELNLSIWPTALPNGMNWGYVVIRNVSWERDLISGLIETEERYQTIFTKSNAGIIFTDLEGRIMEGNPAFLEMTGYSREDLTSRKALALGDLMARDTLNENERSLAASWFQFFLTGPGQKKKGRLPAYLKCFTETWDGKEAAAKALGRDKVRTLSRAHARYFIYLAMRSRRRR